MHEGVEGLLRDKTRPSRAPPLGREIADRVVALTLSAPRHEATHWTAPAMAKTVGISVSAVQRIWRAHGLQPHRVRQFKLSRDPEFIPKLRDIVGLYVDPPAHAVVLSVDEKSQIQALDRTQPGLPMKTGRAGTMTHDVRRQRPWDRLGGLNKRGFLAHLNPRGIEDETEHQSPESIGREGREGHPAGDSSAVRRRREDPDRSGGPARRGQYR